MKYLSIAILAILAPAFAYAGGCGACDGSKKDKDKEETASVLTLGSGCGACDGSKKDKDTDKA